MNFYDWYVLSAQILFLVLFGWRTLSTQLRTGRAIVLGTKRLSEAFLPPTMLLWFVTCYLRALPGAPLAILERDLLEHEAFRAGGAALVLFALIWFSYALISMGHAWRVGVDDVEATDIRRAGAFAYSRNPVFLGMDLFFLGTTLIYSSLSFIVLAGGLMVFLHLQILQEEGNLLSTGGASYAYYRNSVRRYI